jgi:hypothetical protein
MLSLVEFIQQQSLETQLLVASVTVILCIIGCTFVCRAMALVQRHHLQACCCYRGRAHRPAAASPAHLEMQDNETGSTLSVVETTLQHFVDAWTNTPPPRARAPRELPPPLQLDHTAAIEMTPRHAALRPSPPRASSGGTGAVIAAAPQRVASCSASWQSALLPHSPMRSMRPRAAGTPTAQ